jgi:hypothetical protein
VILAGAKERTVNDQSNRKLRDVLGIAPDGRHIHHWIGKDRDKDIAALTSAIVGIGELFEHQGTLVQLSPAGELIPTNLAGLQEFIDKHICGMRIVKDGIGWRREYFTWPFYPAPRPAQGTVEAGIASQGSHRTAGPDQVALRQIYLEDLLGRLPRVEVGE